MRLVLLLMFALAASAQVFGVLPAGMKDGEVTFLFTPDAAALATLPVKNEPYSADRVTKLNGSEIFQSVYRDSEGRARTEGIAGQALAEIVDPVAKFAYLIDDAHKVVHRISMPSIEMTPLIRKGGQGIGVAGGMASSAIGGSTGTVTKLINVSHKEPAASLFQVPKGYTIVDEKATFKISFVK